MARAARARARPLGKADGTIVVIVENKQLLLVQNQRRNGSLDWSTPGGVVDPGEEVLQALQREVIEETAVVVDGWSALLYTVDVDFVGRDMTLHAQVFRATGHTGTLHVDDPDNVVVGAQWATSSQAQQLLDTSPRWVGEPLRHCLAQVMGPPSAPAASLASAELVGPQPHEWRYRVTGTGRNFETEVVASPTLPT